MIAVGRISGDERTRTCVAKRAAQGKSNPDIIWCLKWLIARDGHVIEKRSLSTTLRAAVAITLGSLAIGESGRAKASSFFGVAWLHLERSAYLCAETLDP
jgi:hypothetical protein